MTVRALTLERKWALSLFAAALAFSPGNLVSSAAPALGVTVMASKIAEKRQSTSQSKLGPIPLDNFGNDIEFTGGKPSAKDKDLRERIAAEKARNKGSK